MRALRGTNDWARIPTGTRDLRLHELDEGGDDAEGLTCQANCSIIRAGRLPTVRSERGRAVTDPTDQQVEPNRLADWLQAELDKYDFSRAQAALSAWVHRLPSATRLAWKLEAIGELALFLCLAMPPLATANAPADHAWGRPL
jgi:hypothetical protein